MRRRSPGSLAVSLLLVTAAAVSAQEPGALRGRVTDVEAVGLVGVDVHVAGTPLRAVTDRDGLYAIDGVPAGRRTVRVRGLGYEGVELTVSVPAHGSARVDVVLEVEPIALEGLAVEGQRKGQAMAFQQQRTADNLRSVVAAEWIGRLPDSNAAEALRRLPGVSVERDQGEGRYVIVRGAEPRLNTVAVDGLPLPAPEGDVRTVALDVVPTDLLAAVEVHKSPTPDMDAGAVGGTVNLVTRDAPLHRDVAELSVAGGRNALSSSGIGHLSGRVSSRFGADDRHGLALGGSYHTTDRGAHDVEMEWTEEYDTDVLDDLELRDYRVSRTRLGVGAVYRIDAADAPSPFSVRALFNEYRDQEFRRRSRIRFGKGDFLSASSVEDARLEQELKDRLEVQRIASVVASGARLLGRGTLDWQIGWARASEVEPDRRDLTFVQKGVDLSMDVRDPSLPSYTVSRGAEFDRASYDFDEWTVEDNRTHERNLVAGTDFALPIAAGRVGGTLEVGVKARLKEKRRDNDVRVYDGFDGDLTLADVAGTYEPSGSLLDRYRLGPSPDPSGARRFTDARASSFELDDAATREEADAADFSATEDVYAAYLMARLEVGRLRLVPGARVEVTRQRYTGNETTFDEEGDFASTSPVTRSRSATHWLPGLHARLALGARTHLRAAVTRSLGRQDYIDLAPYRLVLREDEEVELGNPALRETTSTNFDLSFESYLRSIGIVSVGLFRKHLDGYTYRGRSVVVGGSLDGFEAIQPRNAGAGRLSGAEVAWSQQLVGLPGALAGLSVHANYTFTRAHVRLDGRDAPSPLPGQARHSGNVALGYEGMGFSGRVAVSFHGAYVAELGDDPGDDLSYGSQTQLDASLAYRVTPSAQLFVEAVNLSDAPLEAFRGERRLPVQRELYSWWGQVGVRIERF